MEPKKLLVHADFVKSLTRSLVVDQNVAADVEQKAWLAALQNPPTSGRSPRSWFSRVIRNFTISTHRGESRRRKYEQASVRSEDTTSPEQMAVRKEALRFMTEAVLSLEEPYLTTIMLRYYEDLSAREVAERLNVPIETVKTRIQRGLSKLRSRLDDTHGGNRIKWCVALAPFAGLSLTSKTAAAAAATAASTASANTVPGLLMISGRMKLGVAAVLLLGTTFTFINYFDVFNNSGNISDSQDGSAVGFSTVDAGGDGSDPDIETSVLDSAVQGNSLEAIHPSGLFIAGQVTDKATGKPVTAFDFKMMVLNKEAGREEFVHETVRDENGRFYFPFEDRCTCFITISSSCYCMTHMANLEVPEGEGINDLNIQLDPGHSLSGRVVDDSSNLPVPGALVGPAEYPTETDIVSIDLLDYKEACVHAETDLEGWFTISGLRSTDKRIVAVHPDFAEGFIDTNPDSGKNIEIRLKRGFRIYGKAFDDNDMPADNLLIRAYGMKIPSVRPVKTAADGSFTTPPVLPGRIFLKAGDPPWEFHGNPDFTEEHKVIDVVDRDMEVRFGRSPGHIIWRGTLYGYDGAPMKEGRVVISPAALGFKEAYWFNLRRYAHCDDNGCFEADKLLPGRYRVAIQYPGRQHFQWGKVVFDRPGVVEKDIDLSLGSSLSGLVVDGLSGNPLIGREGKVHVWQSAGSRKKYRGTLNENGSFEIKGIPPGCYSLQAEVGSLYSDRLIGIKVENARRITDLRLSIFPVGSVRLNLHGFENVPEDRFTLSFAGGPGNRCSFMGTHRIRNGTLEMDYTLQTGRWTASLAFDELGYLEREFEILEDLETDILVMRSDFVRFSGLISIAGEIAFSDGSPAGGVAVFYRAHSVPGFSRDKGELTATTGADGRFMIDGLMPGRWGVKIQPGRGCEIHSPQLWIPSGCENPLRHTMMLPGGSLNGSVVNRQSRMPFSKEHPRRWEVSVLDVKKREYVCCFEGGGSGNLFELSGLNAGDYQLLIEAEGYQDYQSGAFSLNDEQDLCLGEIEMEPCGVLDIEVLNENFQPVESVSVTCDGRHLRSSRSFQGKRRFDKLPIGQVTLTVGSRGYLRKSITVRLVPAEPVGARLVLHPE